MALWKTMEHLLASATCWDELVGAQLEDIDRRVHPATLAAGRCPR